MPLQVFLLDWFTYHDVLQEYAHLPGIGNELSAGNLVIEIMNTEDTRVRYVIDTDIL